MILQLENDTRYYWGVKVIDSDGFSLLGNDSLPQELIGNLKSVILASIKIFLASELSQPF